jgi:hypothetical protein
VCLGDAVLNLIAAPSFVEISGNLMKLKPVAFSDAGTWKFKV